MDYNNLKTLFFTIIVILWCDVFNKGMYSFQTHKALPVTAVSNSYLSSTTSMLSNVTQASSTPIKKSKKLKPLPQKDESFLDIRISKKVFIDKTRYIAELLKDRRRCVLFTRPRRFGKSNFLQMLHSFFSGQKELFRGTWIYSRGNTDKKGEWVEYPVIDLTFSEIADFGDDRPSAKLFQTKLYDALQCTAKFYKLTDVQRSLSNLVEKLFDKFCLPVVILIDEYDYPFTSILHKGPDGSLTEEEKEMLKGMKGTLNAFFNAIKSQIEKNRVKLAFVTGVAQFAFEGLPGSGPNNVVTLDDKYSCMVGFTESEIGKYLRPHIDQFAKIKDTSPQEITKRLFKMYGGYLFSDTAQTKVVNPISLITCLKNGRFSNYWCPIHSLDIVLDKMYADKVTPEHFMGLKELVESLYERNPTHNNIPTSIYLLLYGYLTIKEYIGNWVILDYPNNEIKDVLINNFQVRLMLDYPVELGKDQSNIMKYLEHKQVPPLVEVLNKLGFRNQAPASYQLKIEHEFNATTILYLIFQTIGLSTKIGMKMINLPERNPLGDLDLLIMTEKITFVIEAKYEKENELEGLKQLLHYIITNENAFLHYIAESRNQHKLQNTDEIYLLCLNFKKDQKGSTQSIETFIGLPFQPWEPSKCREEGLKVMKLWFNHMQIKSDMKSIWDKLKSKYEPILLSKAVW